MHSACLADLVYFPSGQGTGTDDPSGQYNPTLHDYKYSEYHHQIIWLISSSYMYGEYLNEIMISTIINND